MYIADLRAAKELDRKAMADVVGGTGKPAFVSPLLGITDIFAPTSQFATQSSVAQAFTGPQSNVTTQLDNDVITAGYGAQALNIGGNHSTSTNVANVTAISAPTLIQA